MDNVPMHKSDVVRAVFEGGRVLHIPTYLPPYSPQLNAIEYCFSSIAYYVNTRRVNNREGLLDLINQAFKTITPEKCMKWHEHVVHWLQHCLDRKPLESRPQVDSGLNVDDEQKVDVEQNENHNPNL